MSGKVAVLILLFAAHVFFGAEYGRYLPVDPGSDRTLFWYFLVSHTLLVLWVSLDARAAKRSQPWFFLLAIAAFGFFAMPFYLGSTRPAGTWYRWLSKGLLYFGACVFAFGEVFQWVFRSVAGP
jgi:hypothetical protein